LNSAPSEMGQKGGRPRQPQAGAAHKVTPPVVLGPVPAGDGP